MHNINELLILGGGTAGLYAGYLLKNADYTSFKILEKNRVEGRKLCIAGGGYGNLTNTQISTKNYVGQDPTFAKYALNKFPSKKALALFNDLEIPLEERDFGQIFSTVKATEFRDKLARNLPLVNNCDIISVSYNNNTFSVQTSKGQFLSKKLIIATGSSAYPQINASEIGLEIAQRMGLQVLEFSPVLTPFMLPHTSPLSKLAGICLDVGIEIHKQKIIRPMLFTHTGVSGPAILLLSCYYPDQPVIIDFLPNENIKELCHAPSNGKLLVKNLLCRLLPDRLAYALTPWNLQDKKVAELSKSERTILENAIHFHELDNVDPASLVKAEAARNGILTHGLNEKTYQAKNNPHLYAVGEVIDITGQLGGYNIHFALASAFCAVQSILDNQ